MQPFLKVPMDLRMLFSLFRKYWHLLQVYMYTFQVFM